MPPLLCYVDGLEGAQQAEVHEMEDLSRCPCNSGHTIGAMGGRVLTAIQVELDTTTSNVVNDANNAHHSHNCYDHQAVEEEEHIAVT